MNGDGQLTVLDFLELQALFVASDRADCDENETLDVLDFIRFQLAIIKGRA